MLQKVNVPRILVQAAFGHHHTQRQRMCAGLIVMAFGVTIAKNGGEIHAYGIHYVADCFGYLVHAIGGIPFVEPIAEWLGREVSEDHDE